MQVTQTQRSSLARDGEGERSTTIMSTNNPTLILVLWLLECIVYSPWKYRETEGIKDIGSNFWSQGRTAEIKDRVVHLDDREMIV